MKVGGCHLNTDSPNPQATQLDTYGTPDVCRITGCKPTQMEHWCRIGIVVPLQDATRGGARKLSGSNAIETALARVFSDLGLSSKQLHHVAALHRAKVLRRYGQRAFGYDLHARALFGILVEQVKGTAAMLGRADDRAHHAWMKEAEAIVKDKNLWRNDARLHPRVETILGSAGGRSNHVEESRGRG